MTHIPTILQNLIHLPRSTPAKITHALLGAALAYVFVPFYFVILTETHMFGRSSYIFTAQFSFLVSWVGFLLLFAAFFGLTKLNLNGFLPTTLAGGLLGPFAMMFFEMLNNSALSNWTEGGFLVMMTSLGAIHAAAFWVATHISLWCHSCIAGDPSVQNTN